MDEERKEKCCGEWAYEKRKSECENGSREGHFGEASGKELRKSKKRKYRKRKI